MAGRSTICSTNKTVDVINDFVMDKFPGHSREYRSFDSIVTDAHLYPTEFLNSLISPSGVPPHEMGLKVGYPVMLLRNVDAQHGHCDDIKYRLTHLYDNVIEAVVAVGAYQVNRLFLPRISIRPSEKELSLYHDSNAIPHLARFLAITSNKAQDQTLDKVGINMDSQFFSHGQY